MHNKKTLNMWVVTANPRDYPGLYVARLCEVTAAGIVHTDTVHTADSLQAIRDAIPQGLHCIPRDPSDPAVVVETWF